MVGILANSTLRKELPVVGGIFMLLLCIGLWVYPDYGISFDEHSSRLRGGLNGLYANYKLGHVIIPKAKVDQMLLSINDKPGESYTETSLLSFEANDHGAFFDLILIGAEVVLGYESLDDIYRIRHLITFLFYWFSLIIFYLFFRRMKLSQWWALLGVSLLFLSPRIFANAFYNMKDIVFMSACLIASYTAFIFLETRQYKWAILHALTCAIAIDIRVPALILPAITLGIIAIRLIQGKGLPLSKTIGPALAYTFLLFGFVIAFWPFLWEDPIGNFMYALTKSSDFPAHKGTYFFGQTVFSDHIPWYYIPAWMTLTIPLLYPAFFLVGLVAMLKSSPTNEQEQTGWWLVMTMLWLPLLVIIGKGSALYNGWRHLYFIYPYFIVIAVIGIRFLYKLLSKMGQRAQITYTTGILLLLGFLSFKNYQLHPVQHSYFNSWAGDDVGSRFDTDYWGLAYKQGFEYLLTHSDAHILNVYVPYEKGPAKSDILSTEEKRRFRFMAADSAKFLMLSQGGYYSDLEFKSIDMDQFLEIYSLLAGQVKIFSILERVNVGPKQSEIIN